MDYSPSDQSAPVTEELPRPHLDTCNPLYVELSRLDRRLSHHLSELRQRGRTILGDAIGGAVIEEGEAEGLLYSLHQTHSEADDDSVVDEDDWESPLEPLRKADNLYALLPIERDLLLLALSVEIDSRYARLVAFLNDHVSMTRPTLGLAMAILLPNRSTARTTLLERLLDNGPLRRFALLNLEGNEPLANRTLVIPDSFWPRLIGLSAVPPFTVHPLLGEDIGKLELPDSTRRQTEITQHWLGSQQFSDVLILINGFPESGREALARCIAAKRCASAIFIKASDLDSSDGKTVADAPMETVRLIATLEREALWHNAAIIVSDPARIRPETRFELLSRLSVPVFFLGEAGKCAQLLHGVKRKTIEVSIPNRDINDRALLWNRLLTDRAVPHDRIDSVALAARFGYGPDRILDALQLAYSEAKAHNKSGPEQADLEAACRRLRETYFGDMAEKLPCPFTDEDIILPAKTRQELDLILAWVKHGARLFGKQGAGQRLHTGQGLACLFSGPPGTGKTMAAQVVARHIDYDIYRIDLSQVVNKYIGETEKHLAKVFDEAQRSKVVLFFDEADTLFGRRSEIKVSHDRYANLEVGYLLQRIEAHEGLTILATNLQKNLDEAFLRRLQVSAEFPLPGAPERLAIWRRLLSGSEDQPPDLDLALLSEHFEVAGGDIRNAIFTAHLFAAEDESPLGMRHLVLGLWRELQKSGRVVDMAHFGSWQEEIAAAMHRFAMPPSS